MELGSFFGKRKIYWYTGFSMQPLLAVGQLLFGYSPFVTLGYIFIFNCLLMVKVKSKGTTGGK